MPLCPRIMKYFHFLESMMLEISKLLNATLVIPKIKPQLVKGHKVTLSFRFLIFSLLAYLLLILSYLVVQNSNLLCLCEEGHFVAALSSDAAIVQGLPKDLRETRKKITFPSVCPRNTPTSEYCTTDVFLNL
jgi:hypothetical protein